MEYMETKGTVCRLLAEMRGLGWKSECDYDDGRQHENIRFSLQYLAPSGCGIISQIDVPKACQTTRETFLKSVRDQVYWFYFNDDTALAAEKWVEHFGYKIGAVRYEMDGIVKEMDNIRNQFRLLYERIETLYAHEQSDL